MSSRTAIIGPLINEKTEAESVGSAPLDVSQLGTLARIARPLRHRVIYPLLGLGWCASHVCGIASCTGIFKIGSRLFLVRVLFVIFPVGPSSFWTMG